MLESLLDKTLSYLKNMGFNFCTPSVITKCTTLQGRLLPELDAVSWVQDKNNVLIGIRWEASAESVEIFHLDQNSGALTAKLCTSIDAVKKFIEFH